MIPAPPDKEQPQPPILRIIIGSDGRVGFNQLTGEMLEVALALSPDDARLRARAAKQHPPRARKRGTHAEKPDRRD